MACSLTACSPHRTETHSCSRLRLSLSLAWGWGDLLRVGILPEAFSFPPASKGLHVCFLCLLAPTSCHHTTGAKAWGLSCLSSRHDVATVPVLFWKIVGQGHEGSGLGPPGHLSLRPLSLGNTPDPSSEPWTRKVWSLLLLASSQGLLTNLHGSLWKKLAFSATQQGGWQATVSNLVSSGKAVGRSCSVS